VQQEVEDGVTEIGMDQVNRCHPLKYDSRHLVRALASLLLPN
jgi:hypothetical protein